MKSSTPPRLVSGASWVFVAGLVAAWGVVGINHLDTDHGLNHVTGAWIGLSHWAQQGKFYPPMEDAGFYGGTRFGPLAVGLQSAAHAATNHPIVGAKLLHLLYMLATMAGLVVIFRRMRLPGYLIALLATAPLVTWLGWGASLTIRHDLLAVALQLWAVIILAKPARTGEHPGGVPGTLPGALPAAVPGVGRVVGVAVLCALAGLGKFSGLWATAACGLYLLSIAPKRAFLFGGVWAGVLVGGLLLAELISKGHFSATLAICLFPDGVDGQPMGPRLLSQLKDVASQMVASPVMLLLPLGVVGFWLARQRERLLAVSAVFVALMTTYLMTRDGVTGNHLIDLFIFNIIGLGAVLAALQPPAAADADTHDDRDADAATLMSPRAIRGLYALSAVVFVFAGSAMMLVQKPFGSDDVRARLAVASAKQLLGKSKHRSVREATRRWFEPGANILSVDPMVPVLLGRDPVVVDSFMLRVYFAKNPGREVELVERIQRQEFDAVLLMKEFGGDFENWEMVARMHWGKAVLDAIREHYVFDVSGDYAVYLPREKAEAENPTAPAPPTP